MKLLTATGAATLYGLSLRVIFGISDGNLKIMSMSFLILSPVIIGFLTVYFFGKKKNLNYTQAFFVPWLTSLVILAITIAVKLEGTICWIMIYPLFAIAAGIGGTIAHRVFGPNRFNNKNNDVIDDGWSHKLKFSGILILPLFFGLIEKDNAWKQTDMELSRSITIKASSEEIWNSLLSIGKIKPSENSNGITNWIGFPSHLETILDTAAIGGKRKAIYENGLYFDETITALIPHKLLKLKIDVDPTKIPPTVMDEHILIGGQHVDIYEDTYTFSDAGEGETTVTLKSEFMINTPFNWYTKIWAKYLMNDLLDGQLELLESRVN